MLKVNDHDVLHDEDPTQALTGSVADALRLGCVGIGLTIYPGSTHRLEMYSQIRAYAEEAKRDGLVQLIWSYPRGSGLSKAGETGIDAMASAAHLAAQLGAHVIKVKIPREHIEQEAARKVYEECKAPVHSLTERIRHVVQSCFSGRRVLIFSGGPTAGDDEVFSEVRAMRDGGGFGSIIGRNSCQRSEPDALKFLDTIMNLYTGTQA